HNSMKPRTVILSSLSLLLMHPAIAQRAETEMVPEPAFVAPVSSPAAAEPLTEGTEVSGAPLYPAAAPDQEEPLAATMGDRLLTEDAEAPVADPAEETAETAPEMENTETDFAALPPIEPEQPVIQEAGAKVSVDF